MILFENPCKYHAIGIYQRTTCTSVSPQYFLKVNWHTKWILHDVIFKVYLPEDIQTQGAANREVIANIHSSFNKLRDVAERMAQRSRANSTDLLMFGKDLRWTLQTILNWIYIYGHNHSFNLKRIDQMWIWINGFEYKYINIYIMRELEWYKNTHKCKWLMYDVQKYSCTVCHDVLIILMLTLIYEWFNIYN